MNILVCVKQVPKEEDMKLDPVTKTLIRSQGTGVISEHDRFAMELAARLKAEVGGSITAVTMGPPQAAEVLRYCLAVGADDTCLLSDRAMGGADAYATVNVLAAARAALEQQKGAPFDLILTGSQASDSDTSLVMPELAEALNLPQVTFVKNYELKNGVLRVWRETDDGEELLSVTLPAVLSVGKTDFPARFPNLRLKLKANHTEIPTLSAADLDVDPETIGVKGSKTVVGSSYFPEHNKNSIKVEGADAAEIADKLLSLLRASKVL